MISRRSLLISAAALPLAAPALAKGGPIKLRDLYNKDRSFSDLAQENEGKRIDVEGFMAPPLKAEMKFFVLTKMPLAICPFCETDAEWPDSILAIYTKRVVDVIPFNVKIETSGVLELGGFKDPDTGFYSKIRLAEATYA